MQVHDDAAERGADGWPPADALRLWHRLDLTDDVPTVGADRERGMELGPRGDALAAGES